VARPTCAVRGCSTSEPVRTRRTHVGRRPKGADPRHAPPSGPSCRTRLRPFSIIVAMLDAVSKRVREGGRLALPEKVNCAIENTSIAADDWDLLEAVGQELGWGAARAHPLTRYGFSGARIYLLEPKLGYGGISHIVKISTSSDIAEEVAGMQVARSHVRRFSAFSEYAHPQGRISAISIPLFTARQGPRNAPAKVMDAADVYERVLSVGPRGSRGLEYMLKDALDLLDRAHVLLPDRKAVTYKSCCKRYLRQKHPSRIDALFEAGDFEIQGYRVTSNPRLALNDLLNSFSIGFTCSVIHGDLHLSNIVADGNIAHPTLIDYAWTKRFGHVLLDYVMLESSLRMMRFPRSVNPGLILAVDRALVADFSGGDARALLTSLTSGSTTRKRVEVMLGAVETVRRQAKTLAKASQISDRLFEAEYFKLLYIVLCGQEKFDDYPLLRTIVNLDLLRQQMGT
jgi:Ternary complex associated domain 9